MCVRIYSMLCRELPSCSTLTLKWRHIFLCAIGKDTGSWRSVCWEYYIYYYHFFSLRENLFGMCDLFGVFKWFVSIKNQLRAIPIIFVGIFNSIWGKVLRFFRIEIKRIRFSVFILFEFFLTIFFVCCYLFVEFIWKNFFFWVTNCLAWGFREIFCKYKF